MNSYANQIAGMIIPYQQCDFLTGVKSGSLKPCRMNGNGYICLTQKRKGSINEPLGKIELIKQLQFLQLVGL